MATEKTSIFDSAAGLTPAGFAANIAADSIATPNTSRSGDITTGPTNFGDVNVSRGFPWYVWALAAVAVVAIFRSR